METIKPRLDDYTRGVKDREHRQWTEKEMQMVFTLRERNRTSMEIAHRMNATRVQVYNVTRLMRRKLNNQCSRCGNPLTNADQKKNVKRKLPLCIACQKFTVKYKSLLRNQAMERGLCGYCHKRKVIPKFRACPKCISATQRRRNKMGLCALCGEKPIRETGFNDGRTRALCDACVRIMRNARLLQRHIL